MDRQSPLTIDRVTTHPARRASGRCLSAVAALFLLAYLAPGTPPATAASHRLSQGLPFSDVVPGRTQLSPDGRFAVYVHDATVDGAQELWSVRVAGGAPVRLSGLLPVGVSVDDFQISADSQRVVYMAAQETTGQTELYSIPIAGPEGSWIKLNDALPAGGDVSNLQISPDSTSVIYLADQAVNNILDAWTVPIDGGTPTKLRPFITLAGSTVYAFSAIPISPDGERVAFRANFSDLDKVELWSARVDGTGAVTRINGTLNAGGNVTRVLFSPDSSRVVYLADQQTDEVFELYSVPTAGGSAVKLNGALTAGGDVELAYDISPDSSRVIYRADQQTDEKMELYSVPLAGGGATKLNGTMIPNGFVFEALISPDSSRVVYQATQDSAAFAEIYSVPLAGGSAVKLNPALPAGANPYALAIAPDSANVVYMADQINFGEVELFSVPLAGGASVRVSDDLAFGGNVTAFKIAPTSGFAFYLADLVTDGVSELFRGRIAGISGADERVSGPLVAGGAVGGGLSWAILPDGRQAIYNADQEVDGQSDLYLGDLCVLCDGFEGGDSGRWD